MEPKVEQWMRDAVDEMWNSNLLLQCELLKALHIIASHAPQPSPDICEKCGQEVVDGHWSLVCHKPSCIAALQDVAPEREETGAFSDKMARWEYEICDDMDLSDAWSVWHAAWSRLRDLVTTQRKEDRKEA